MENQSAVARLFGSTKALILMLVVLGAFVGLFLGKVMWGDVKELLMILVPSFFVTHAAADVAHAMAAPKLEIAKRVSVRPPSNAVDVPVSVPPDPKVPPIPPLVVLCLGALLLGALLLVACGAKVEPLGPKEKAALAGHAVSAVACYERGLAAGSLPDGGHDKEKGLATFDACLDGGAK
jgi:hypothetical protein